MELAALVLAKTYLQTTSDLRAFAQTVSCLGVANDMTHGFVTIAASFIGVNSKKKSALAQQVSTIAIKALSTSLTVYGGYSLLVRVIKQISFFDQQLPLAASVSRRELTVLLGASAVCEIVYKVIFSLIGPSKGPEGSIDPVIAGPKNLPSHFGALNARLTAYLGFYNDQRLQHVLHDDQKDALKYLKAASRCMSKQLYLVGAFLLFRKYYFGFFGAPLVLDMAENLWHIPYSLLAHWADVNSKDAGASNADTPYVRKLALSILAHKKPISAALETIAWVGTCFMCIYALRMSRDDALKMVGKLIACSLLERLISDRLIKRIPPPGVQDVPLSIEQRIVASQATLDATLLQQLLQVGEFLKTDVEALKSDPFASLKKRPGLLARLGVVEQRMGVLSQADRRSEAFQSLRERLCRLKQSLELPSS